MTNAKLMIKKFNIHQLCPTMEYGEANLYRKYSLNGPIFFLMENTFIFEVE